MSGKIHDPNLLKSFKETTETDSHRFQIRELPDTYLKTTKCTCLEKQIINLKISTGKRNL